MLLRCRIPLASFEVNIDVSFEARIAAIFGPSGSGKTTLLDAIAGLRPITAGEIEIEGNLLFSSDKGVNLPARQRGIGYVPQEAALFPHLSVKENILFGAERGGKTGLSPGIELSHVLDVLEIGGLLDRPIAKLSGGETQRVALARAILSRPQLLLLDEPLAALDVGLKEKILPYLGRVRDEFAIPMVYVTHNLAEVLTLADWVLMVQHGRLMAQGAPKEMLRSMTALQELSGEQIENVFTATLLESDPAGGTSRVRTTMGAELLVPFVSSAEKSSPSLQMGVGADEILLATEQPRGISASNVIPGTVRSIDFISGEAMVTVVGGEEFLVRVTASAIARLGLKADNPVFLIIKARSIRLV
jgi:molybdate transport system ATP-binding protein